MQMMAAMQRVRNLTILRRVVKGLLLLYGFVEMNTALIVFLDLKDVTTIFLPGASAPWVVWRAAYFFVQAVGFMALVLFDWRLDRNDEYVRRTARFLDFPDAVFTRVSGPFRVALTILAAGFFLQFADETALRATIFAPAQLTIAVLAFALLLAGVFPIPLPASETNGRKVIRGSFIRSLVHLDVNEALDQRFGPKMRIKLADQLAAELSSRTNYQGLLTVALSDPAVGDGRPFVINSRVAGKPSHASPQAQLLDLTISVLSMIGETLHYEGRAAVSFVGLEQTEGKYVSCRGNVRRAGTRVIIEPDSDICNLV
jgi:hypothetical protein